MSKKVVKATHKHYISHIQCTHTHTQVYIAKMENFKTKSYKCKKKTTGES